MFKSILLHLDTNKQKVNFIIRKRKTKIIIVIIITRKDYFFCRKIKSHTDAQSDEKKMIHFRLTVRKLWRKMRFLRSYPLGIWWKTQLLMKLHDAKQFGCFPSKQLMVWMIMNTSSCFYTTNFPCQDGNWFILGVTLSTKLSKFQAVTIVTEHNILMREAAQFDDIFTCNLRVVLSVECLTFKNINNPVLLIYYYCSLFFRNVSQCDLINVSSKIGYDQRKNQ